MATAKQKEKLESLLDWKREGRLFDNVDLFNLKISETLSIRELSEKKWMIDVVEEKDGNIVHVISIPIRHKTLINLALSIMDAVNFTDKR